jgi:hypothetical protein
VIITVYSQLEISKTFAALENLAISGDINKAWEVLKRITRKRSGSCERGNEKPSSIISGKFLG